MSLILYTEDDAIMQADGYAVLGEAGYEVMTASMAPEAIALLRECGARVSALITDINLSGHAEGWSVAEAGRAIRGSLPVIYVSSSDRGALATRGVPGGVWISKPFEWPRLLRTMSGMLAHQLEGVLRHYPEYRFAKPELRESWAMVQGTKSGG